MSTLVKKNTSKKFTDFDHFHYKANFNCERSQSTFLKLKITSILLVSQLACRNTKMHDCAQIFHKTRLVLPVRGLRARKKYLRDRPSGKLSEDEKKLFMLTCDAVAGFETQTLKFEEVGS